MEKIRLLRFLRGLSEYAELWSDVKIETGDIWDDDIKAKLKGADIALIIVSQFYLDSSYCKTVEIPEFIRQASERGLIIFPIILSMPLIEKGSWLNRYQHIPREGRNILQHYQDDGARYALFVEIRTELMNKIDLVRRRKAAEVASSLGPISATSPIGSNYIPVTHAAPTHIAKVRPSTHKVETQFHLDLRPIPQASGIHFLMGAKMITNKFFRRFIEENLDWDPHGGACFDRKEVDTNYLHHWKTGRPFDPEFPVTNISFLAAEAFSRWATKQYNTAVRLPSVKEWKIAAQAGRREWVEDEIKAGRVNYYSTHGRLKPVASLPANPYGIHDMLGNVFDMCIDYETKRPIYTLAGGAYFCPKPGLALEISANSKSQCLLDAGFRLVHEVAIRSI